MAVFLRESPTGQRVDLSSSLRGTNMIENADGTLSPIGRPRRFWEWDYFWTGQNASGTIGRMRWNLLGSGTPAYTRVTSTFGNSSKGQLTTSAVTNNRSCLVLGDVENRVCCDPLNFAVLQTLWRMQNSLATKSVFFGFSSNYAVNPVSVSSNAFGVVYDSALSPNYQLLMRQAAALQLFDTGQVVPQNTGQLMTFVQTATGTFEFWLASAATPVQQATLVATVAGVPAFGANHGYRLETLANVVSGVELGYWGMLSTQIGGLYSADTDVLGS